MKAFFNNVKKHISLFYFSVRPGSVAIKGAVKAIATSSLIIWLIVSSAFFLIAPKTWFGIFPILIIPLAAILLGGLTVLLHKLLIKLPKPLIWVLPGTYLLMSLAFGQGSLSWQFPLFVLVFAGFAGGGIYTLSKRTRAHNTLRQKIVAYLGLAIGLSGLVWGLIWAFDTGFEQDPQFINASLAAEYSPDQITLDNPGLPGTYVVKTMSYGSGKDLHRPAFSTDMTITTDSVDGSRLIDNWEGLSGKLRTWYWGFDDTALPINGRVWYPEGEGPFPLTLIVHGNHGMFDYSDEGYAYLGELLASHGIILVSVDENFINSGWTDVLTDGLDEENDARGWLMLKHLQEWRSWNTEPENPFFQKVDMDQIAVMGHSRGGEAAAVAAFLNQLEYYPDDAKEEFDFGFNIKSVVSIAPVDGQYKPAEVSTPLADVNYFVIHGSNDGDVQSFSGLRQYERLTFSDSSEYFKSALYVYGANHGQFNTSWGNKDSPQPWASLLNLEALIPMEDQLTIGKVFINAFLLRTLKGQSQYEALFKDYRSGSDWLPKTIYLNQFEASNWQKLTTYDEDLDLTSAQNGIEISGEHLTVWREQLVSMKYGNKGTRGAYLGWDSTAYPMDTARYTLIFPEDFTIENVSFLTMEIAESKESSYPDKERDEELKKSENEEAINEEGEDQNESNSANEQEEEEEEEEEEKAPEPINLSIELEDRSGKQIKFDLSSYALLQPQLTVDIYKNKSLQTNKTSEPVYQTFFFNIDRLTQQNVDFDKNALSRISLVFDKTQKGVIILDKIAVH